MSHWGCAPAVLVGGTCPSEGTSPSDHHLGEDVLSKGAPDMGWPLQIIRSLQSFLAQVSHPCIAPSICIAHTIAILLHH